MSSFWHYFVAGVALAAILACLWLLFGNARGTPGGTTGHTWDDDLREYNNPLPRWWLNLFVLTVVFGLGYLVFFPGLGNFAGTRAWSQQSQLDHGLQQVREQRQAHYARLGDRSIPELAKDSTVLPMGRAVFLSNCAGCHGADARGARGFPSLGDGDWLYGGTPEAIVASITQGRQGQMPYFNGRIDAETGDALFDTLRHWTDEGPSTPARAKARAFFAGNCAVCHGADAKGNQIIGAPNLTDSIWLHGGSREQIRETVLWGRKSNMPAHKDLLSPDDIRVVAAYVYSLSKPQ